MKLKQIGIYAACALMLASCGNGAEKSADDFKDVKLDAKSSTADSLAYLMGDMMGLQTQQMASNDSTVNKDAFNKGFYAGIAMVKTDDMSFNQGLMAGIQAAGQLADMKKSFGVETSVDALASGYKNGLKEKAEDQTMMDIQGKMMNAMRNALATASNKAVKAYANGKDYKNEGNAYYKVKKAGDGQQLAKGVQTAVKMRLLDTKGKEVMPGAGDQASPVMVGQAPMSVLNTVLPKVKEGTQLEVLTTGAEIFNGRTPQGINPMDVLVLSIEVVPYESEASTPSVPTDSVAAVPANTGM